MENVLLLIKIVMVNMVLSGDNAVVIAMASKNLPDKQRKQAVWWGAFGAVGLRVLLTGAAVLLLRIPLLQVIGSLLLMGIAIKLLLDEEAHGNIRSESTLMAAVWTIITADFVMSLDNVLAIAAIANGSWSLVVIGIMISIPMIIWGSNIVMKLLNQYPVLIYLGSAILGYTAGEMFLKDRAVEQWLHAVPSFIEWCFPLAAAAGVVAAGLWKKSRV